MRRSGSTTPPPLRRSSAISPASATGTSSTSPVRLRRGVLDAMSARGVRGEVIETDYSPSQVSSVMRSLLSRAELPTAVVFDNDMMAIAGLRVTQEMGVRVPGELSLASFDDSIVTGLVHPSITCLTRDTFLLGERAADFLLEQLDASEVLPDRMGPVPTLTVRESTGRPAS